jgi:uncharacterized protein YceH (UPF0502 family)
MDLSDTELRVLGCLIEKEMTTPDYYPMTINALLAAGNQKSNRFPVVDYSETDVITAVDGLRERGLARTVHGKGDRALKYKHVAGETLEISARQTALLAIMLLRGPQTLGELRSRTGRYTEFADLADIAAELEMMAAAEEPTVTMLERRPGEKESRYRQLLGGWDTQLAPDPVAPAAELEESRGDRVADLESELAQLRARVSRIERDLGLDSSHS